MGYEQLPTSNPLAPIAPKLLSQNRRSAVYRAPIRWPVWATRKPLTSALLKKSGANPGRQGKHPIRLLNPIASHLSVMRRSSLLGSLLQVLEVQPSIPQSPRARVFELGGCLLER